MEILGSQDCAQVEPVVGHIAQMLSPCRIFLYNMKVNALGEVTSFKLCVVAPLPDRQDAERTIYREVDCDIPFDVLLYTPEEWEWLSGDPVSFAHHINTTGTVVYG